MTSLCPTPPQEATRSFPPDPATFTASVSTTTQHFPQPIYSIFKWIEDIEAQSRITTYLKARGRVQRMMRDELVHWFSTSRSPHRHIEMLLEQINTGTSEPRLEAVIDLLSRLGPAVVDMAAYVSHAPQYKDSVAAYALALAAGRSDSSIVPVLLNSLNSACREAVIDLIDDLPEDTSHAFLQRLASDSNPSLRKLAQLSLAE